jgi:hypothetical protein
MSTPPSPVAVWSESPSSGAAATLARPYFYLTDTGEVIETTDRAGVAGHVELVPMYDTLGEIALAPASEVLVRLSAAVRPDGSIIVY